MSIKALIITLLLFPILSFAQNALYLEQNIENSGDQMMQALSEPTSVWITDNHVRLQQSKQVLIFDFAKQEIVTLLPEQNTYFNMSFEQTDQLLNISNMFINSGEDAEFVRAQETKYIENWPCYQVKAQDESYKIELWLTEEIDVDRKELLKVYKRLPGMSAFVKFIEQMEEHKGFPVLTKMEMDVFGMKVRTTVTLKKIERKEVAANLFMPPANYKKVANPLEELGK